MCERKMGKINIIRMGKVKFDENGCANKCLLALTAEEEPRTHIFAKNE